MLIVFPLGLLATAIAFDIAFLSTQNPRWADVSFWMVSCGLIGGAAAAVFGIIDWRAIPAGTRAYRIGIFHGLGNAMVMLLFFVSWLARYDRPDVTIGAFVLALCGVSLALVTGWLGGELVDRLGVGVDQTHDLNAPSSLTHD
jgi:uncharacterized membrane protein